MNRPTIRLPDGRHAEIVRKRMGENLYDAVVREWARRDRRPLGKVVIRPEGDGWAVVRETGQPRLTS